MFSYFGSKSKIVHLYPPPKHGKIIEPFAGSARYALKYPENEVLLIDKDPTICEIWNWLINEATPKDIQSFPKLSKGDDLRDVKWLTQVERDLLGFVVGMGRRDPGYVVTGNAAYDGWIELRRFVKRCCYYLPRVKHWRVLNKSYKQYAPNLLATWFIDPPYIWGGNITAATQLITGN